MPGRSHAMPGVATLAAALIVIAVAAPLAGGAVPTPNAAFSAHDHETVRDNWHVEAEISSTGKSVRTLVLYVEKCKQTVLAKNVPITSADGDFVAELPVAGSGGKGPGAWRVAGRFVEPTHLEGTYEMTAGTCATGVRAFHAHTGDHAHGPSIGTPMGQYPDIAKASDARRIEARRLWHQTRASAGSPALRSYAAARRNHFVRVPVKRIRPLIFHLRQKGYERDRHVLDARRPESLVYWWPLRGQPVLLAFMYRAPADDVPTFGSPLIGWHGHLRADGGAGTTQMTHVWLTGDLRSAYANCMPIQALEAAIPAFRFSPPGETLKHGSLPCPG